MPPFFYSPRATILDLGASRTAFGVFSRKSGRLRLEQYAVETLSTAAGSDDNWLENTAAALLALRRRVKAPGSVVLVLPAHLVLTKLIKTPRVEPAKRERVLHFEAGQSIPFALPDVIWDSVVAGESNAGLDVLLAAVKRDAVEQICRVIQETGFVPQYILPSSLATLAGYRLQHAGKIKPSLVLNLGARSTTLFLAEAKRFVTRTLSLGGNSITQQIAENQDCDAEAAESIKLSDRSASLTAGAMETLATRLAQEITRTVLHFRRQSDLENPEIVYLTGGGARLAGLDEALAAKLKIPVDRLDLLGAIEIARGASDAGEHELMLADLVGAAATQLLRDQAALNLLPPRLRRQDSLRRRQPWLMAAAVLTVAALIPPLVHFRSVTGQAQRKTATIERELAPLRERDARNRASLQQLGELKQQIAQLQGVYDRRTGWLNLLADLQDRLVRVEDVWLEKLQVTPAASGAPLKLVISGRMLDKTNPLSKVSPETFNRVKALLASIVDSPYVATVEGERFDNDQPGILKFDFVLVTDPARPL